MRPDPIGLVGGINLFAYVNSDPINWVDIDGLYRSHWVLRALIPGQVAWDNALTAFENGDLGSAALHAGAMVGEQVLAAYMGKLSSMSGRGCPVRPASKSAFSPPKISVNSRGNLTNGSYILDEAGMVPHKMGSLRAGKSQFLSLVDAEKAVLDAASYAE